MSDISKVDGMSLDLEKQNIDKIKELFPEAVEEGKINFDMLRAMLGDEIDDSREKYQFTWNGKAKAIKMAQTPSSATLRPCKEKSKDWDTTENLYIEGDNLEVLKQLQKTYYGKLKMVFIDPPYNTGNDFVYNDSFSNSIDNYKMQTNQKVCSNPESNGRFHTDWLNMMYPRLILARNLLRDDGVIFMTIDDNELNRLISICDEVFGEANFINIISLKLKNNAGASGGGEDKRLKKNCEYILLYAKNYFCLNSFNGPYEFTEMSELIQQYLEEGKSWKYTSVLLSEGSKEYIGSTVDGEGNEIKIFARKEVEFCSINEIAKQNNISIKEAYKKFGTKIFRTTNAQTSIRLRVMDYCKIKNINDDFISIEYIPRSGKNKGKIYEQFYKDQNCNLLVWLKDTSEEIGGELYKRDLQGTFWDFVGETKNLTREGDVPFPNGKKPVKLIKQMLSMVTTKDDIVLDFFSGSATTAHAIMKLNAEDGSNRKFIMVQLPELCDEKSEAYKAGYKNICEIGEERIRRAGEQIKADWEKEHPTDGLFGSDEEFTTDIGFKVFKLDSTNVNEWDPNIKLDEKELAMRLGEVFKEDRSKEDILYEIMLKYGVFDKQVEKICVNGKTIYRVGKRYMIVCLEDSITSEDVKAIGELSPKTVIFNEAGFNNDNDKINAVYNLEEAGVEDVKCI